MKKQIARLLALVFIASVCIVPIAAFAAYNGHTWQKYKTQTNYTKVNNTKHVRTVTEYYKCTHVGCSATDVRARTYTENHISKQKDGDPFVENNPTAEYTDAGHPHKWVQLYKKCPCGFQYDPLRWPTTMPHTIFYHEAPDYGGVTHIWYSCNQCEWRYDVQ